VCVSLCKREKLFGTMGCNTSQEQTAALQQLNEQNSGNNTNHLNVENNQQLNNVDNNGEQATNNVSDIKIGGDLMRAPIGGDIFVIEAGEEEAGELMRFFNVVVSEFQGHGCRQFTVVTRLRSSKNHKFSQNYKYV
jgi:hypothetical protein